MRRLDFGVVVSLLIAVIERCLEKNVMSLLVGIRSLVLALKQDLGC